MWTNLTFFIYRSITKINKITGSKVQFMSDHPEFGRLDSLDIYADEKQDGKLWDTFLHVLLM